MQQRGGAQYHARGAVAALHGTRIEECLLHGGEFTVLLQAFDGRDLLADGVSDQRLTGVNGLPVHQYGTCAALALAATVLGSGQVHSIAQDGEQGLVGGRADFHLCAVDVQNIIAHLGLQAGWQLFMAP